MLDQLVPFDGNMTYREHKPGAYILVQNSTGIRYIGSSKNPINRISKHKNLLKQGKHYSHELQAAYTHASDYEHVIYLTPDRETAYDLEQALLDNLPRYYTCANISKTARDSFLGRTHSDDTKALISRKKKGRVLTEDHIEHMRQALIGRPVSEATRALLSELKTGVERPVHIKALLNEANAKRKKKVLINGIVYASVSDCARSLKVSNKTVLNRIASNNPAFNDWQLV